MAKSPFGERKVILLPETLISAIMEGDFATKFNLIAPIPNTKKVHQIQTLLQTLYIK